MRKNAAIALGLVTGLLFGLIAGLTEQRTLVAIATGVAPIGTAFINLIKMVVVPLVAASLFCGVATLGDLRQLGRSGGIAVLFIWGTTLLAIGIGIAASALALPFAGSVPAISGTHAVEAAELPGFLDFLVSLIPPNAVAAAAEGALLPLIVFTVLFAAAAGTLPQAQRQPLLDFGNAVTHALITLVHWVLWTAPVGVFALAAPVAVETGWQMLRSLGVFVVAVVVGLVAFVAVVYLPAIRLWARLPVRRFLRANAITAPIAFSTTSSAASLPAMFEAAEEELHIPRTITSLVLPLGAAINRSGSALYQGAALVFLAHLYGVPIGLASLTGAIVATFLVALTVAAVPSASVMTLPPALMALGVPLDGVAIMLGIDRIPDMFRTVVNVMGDVAAAAVVDGKVDRPDEIHTGERALAG